MTFFMFTVQCDATRPKLFITSRMWTGWCCLCAEFTALFAFRILTLIAHAVIWRTSLLDARCPQSDAQNTLGSLPEWPRWILCCTTPQTSPYCPHNPSKSISSFLNSPSHTPSHPHKSSPISSPPDPKLPSVFQNSSHESTSIHSLRTVPLSPLLTHWLLSSCRISIFICGFIFRIALIWTRLVRLKWLRRNGQRISRVRVWGWTFCAIFGWRLWTGIGLRRRVRVRRWLGWLTCFWAGLYPRTVVWLY